MQKQTSVPVSREDGRRKSSLCTTSNCEFCLAHRFRAVSAAQDAATLEQLIPMQPSNRIKSERPLETKRTRGKTRSKRKRERATKRVATPNEPKQVLRAAKAKDVDEQVPREELHEGRGLSV